MLIIISYASLGNALPSKINIGISGKECCCDDAKSDFLPVSIIKVTMPYTV
jgi:hypothetical protein